MRSRGRANRGSSKRERAPGKVPRPAGKISPAIRVARELWRRGRFTDAVQEIHEKLGIQVDYVPDLPQFYYNQQMAVGHPELASAGLAYARKCIDMHGALFQTPSVVATRARDKMPRKAADQFFGKPFENRLVEESPQKGDFEEIAGEKISDERFRQMVRSETSQDLISRHAFELIMAFGDAADLSRLRSVMNNPLLYHWRGYAYRAVDIIEKRLHSN
ncbi:MAG: hypothetical protein NT067_00300 [Candidatus Diapherotrites archaeon]|nr:hypothetical protein [Candidatus Diapherotrites archaeon]